MGRRRYVLAYDIRDPHRLRHVHKTVRGFGYAFQYSVFICDLDGVEKVALQTAVGGIIDHRVDQVALIDLGEIASEPHRRFEFLGPPSPLPVQEASIF